MKFIPVIHYESKHQAAFIENIQILLDLHVKDVILCGAFDYFEMLSSARIAYDLGFNVGANFLCQDIIQIPEDHVNYFEYLWYDDSKAGLEENYCKAVWDRKPQLIPKLLGGVAFKYQRQPRDLKAACDMAIKYMDCVVTSGEGTGMAADIDKINRMRDYIDGRKPLGLASGITPENVKNYDVDYILVNTGISKTFYNFDKDRIKKLLDAIS